MRTIFFCCLLLIDATCLLPLVSAATPIAAKRRTVIVTGANRGIGLAAVKALSTTNEWNIIMACRSLEKGERAKELIKSNEFIEVCELDLSDLRSVKKFASKWGNRPLHVLACNAGVHTRICYGKVCHKFHFILPLISLFFLSTFLSRLVSSQSLRL